MYGPEDPRRKNGSNHNLKNLKSNNSHNALLSTLDRKRSDLSKQKVKIHQMPEQSDVIDPKGSAVINFRTIKNNQNTLLTQKNNKDYYQLKIHKKSSTSEPPHAIQPNLNIQNILPNHRKHLTEAHSQRSLSQTHKDESKQPNWGRKPEKLTTNTSALDEFECDEELQLKAERKTEKKVVQPLIQKDKNTVPLLRTKNPQVLDYHRQIRQFQSKMSQLNAENESQSLCFLDSRQICYSIDPLYIQKKQKNLNWTMRAILIEWMMHISYEFRLKRQTFHIAVTLVDNYFQSTCNLSKADFQLTGASALFIAAKLQEFQPLSSKQFAKSTKQRYSAEQIRSMETRILKTLKYNLNPPTINMWANKLMQQWDLFLDTTAILQQDFFVTHDPKYFKKIDGESYKLYRQVMQILDCAMLDIQTVQYKPKLLVCSMLYLILGKELGEFTKKQIIGQFPRTSLFFVEENDFNNIFRVFIEQCLGLKMFEILPSVQYLATYFILGFTYERPCLKSDEESVEEMHLQQYCSYQTYNPNMLPVVRKRFRGIYQ